MALVDAHYCFIMVDAGAYGRNSDGAIFANSTFSKAYLSGNLNIPPGCPLPSSTIRFLYTIVCDEAFPLKADIMCPYAGRRSGMLSNEERIFNYRLSRARMKVENAFGILAQQWRVLHREIDLQVDFLTDMVLATCVLHNYLQKPQRIPTHQG